MYRRAASCPPDQQDTPARQLPRSPDLTPLGGAVPSNVWDRRQSSAREWTMPRPSIGETPMTGAERQARYRAARMSVAPIIRIRRPVDRRSRIQRWNDTITTLTELQAEYGAWLEALPNNQQDGATAEALRTIVELDLSELQAIEPPHGLSAHANGPGFAHLS